MHEMTGTKLLPLLGFEPRPSSPYSVTLLSYLTKIYVKRLTFIRWTDFYK